MQTKLKTFHLSIDRRPVIRDILTQTITGELVAEASCKQLVGLTEDAHQKKEGSDRAQEHARHADGMMNVAMQFSLFPKAGAETAYWLPVRQTVERYARKKDYESAWMIQEIMLGSLTLAWYQELAAALDKGIGRFFALLAGDERIRFNEAIEQIRRRAKSCPDMFLQKLEWIHYDAMPAITHGLWRQGCHKACGVCAESCMKAGLPKIGLSTGIWRENALSLYSVSLERIGVPRTLVTRWIGGLPV